MDAEAVYADILRTLQNSILNTSPSWDDDTDEFLKSMLTGADQLETHLGLSENGSSDTSSDSGCGEEQSLASPGCLEPPRLMSPGLDSPHPASPHSTHSVDLIDYIDSDNGDTVSPLEVEQQADPVEQTTTGTTTTIVLPHATSWDREASSVTITSSSLTPRQAAPGSKRRRISASSSDSGMEDHSQGKYPKLELSEEEQRMADKEGLVFPSHYPLSREEERNLKRIRRKIRNKLSAQDSRKRKKEYMDNMEDRVKACTSENRELKEKIKALETQNKTLAAQLRRLHQIVMNGGLRQGQTSTALMVLLLSTALFLIPGFRDQAETKTDIDIQSAIKMPPMPGSSRSLLWQERPADIDVKDEPADKVIKMEQMEQIEIVERDAPHNDHDYTMAYRYREPVAKAEPGSAWIEEDAPPLGYGAAVKMEDEDRQMNVNVTSSGQGTRTVVLQIPKDIK